MALHLRTSMNTVVPVRVPFGGASICESDVATVVRVLRSGWIAYGPEIESFERSIAVWAGVPAAVTLNSCTSALELALLQAGVRGGVIIPSFTWVAVANSVLNAGARPQFADVDPRTFNLTPQSIESLIDTSSEAVIVPHYGGQPADFEAIGRLCASKGLLLIEDCAETMGGLYRGRLAGSSGIGCFSFYPTKAITTGMGGAIAGTDTAFIDGIRTRATHGLTSSTPIDGTPHRPWERAAVLPGRNLRMPNLLAALGIEQLKRLDVLNEARRAIAAEYDAGLAGLEPDLVRPFRDPAAHHVFQMYSVLVDARRRDGILQALWQNGVSANCHFDPPIHRQPWYETNCRPDVDLPVTESLSGRILTLPMFPAMTSRQVRIVVDALLQAMEPRSCGRS